MEQYFISNEFGELVNVSKEEYLKWKEEHPELTNDANDVPIFKAPEQSKEKETKIQDIKDKLKKLDLSEKELKELEEEIERNSNDKTDVNNKEEKQDER